MKIIIDERKCLKRNLSLQEVLVALALCGSTSYIEILDNLLLKKIITREKGGYRVTPQWKDVIDEILAESIDVANNTDRLENLAKEMQQCFPEGKMHGTAYYYRCNVREITLKLKKFFLQYGDYTDDEIIDATKRFVASFHGNYRYMPLIKYFIMKNKTIMDEDGQRHVVEVSELASYLENQDNEDTVVANSDDWLLSSRN